MPPFPWVVLGFSVSAFVLSVLVVLFATLRLPHLMTQSPASTTYAAVDCASFAGESVSVQRVTQLDAVDLVPGDRVLLKDQRDSRENGIWVVGDQYTLHRAPDMRTAQHIVEGAHVLVRRGQHNKDQTFVLRRLSQDVRLAPGKADIYFVPILTNLFGPAKLPANRVLQVNHRGLAAWDTPDALMSLRRAEVASIPRTLHTIAEAADMTAWEELNQDWKVRVWTEAQCLAHVREHFPAWLRWHENAGADERRNLMRWLVLYTEGGVVVDAHARPLRPLDAVLVELAEPRGILISDATISAHEATTLSRAEIRRGHPCRPGARIGTQLIGLCARHPFVHFMLDHIRSFAAPPIAEQNVEFVCGSDAVTYQYDRVGRDFADLSVLPATQSVVSSLRAPLVPAVPRKDL